MCKRCSKFFLLWIVYFMVMPAWADETQLDEVVITGLRAQPLLQVPGSVTVLRSKQLAAAGQQHFADVMQQVPNLNWSAGSARPRYFQLRGIGELEQYNGAPNSSVGFLVDDMDFSGLGMIASLFDVGQVEVLRGPQGTRLGANALAGLIVLQGNEPESAMRVATEATVGSDTTRAVGVMLTGPLAALDSGWRVAMQQSHSAGFMDNSYLHRDTNQRDEFTGRAKFTSQLSEKENLKISLLHAEVDDGYDAWAINNQRHSIADQPGVDRQNTTGASVHLNSTRWAPFNLVVIGAATHSKTTNSYDADWGNALSWAPYTYDYFAHADRDRDTQSLEVRLLSAETTAFSWLVGAYALNLQERGHDQSVGMYIDPNDPSSNASSDDDLSSRYQATNVAVFSQLEGQLAPRWYWLTGMRVEQRHAHYDDTVQVALQQTNFHAADRMLGGNVSLRFEPNTTTMAYATLARGYKAGGFNLGSIPDAARHFAPEYLWNLELGLKKNFLQGRGYVDAAIFYEWRRHLQVRTGRQLDINNPNTYQFITDNVAQGFNTGIETSAHLALTPKLELGGALGLLRTRASGGLDEQGQAVAAREQAHAPEYTAAVYGIWRPIAGLHARIEVAAKDNFYFDVPTAHNMQSHAYSLTHFELGYARAQWQTSLWVRNVFNKQYAVRGFYFYNEPPFADPHLYLQYGDPRQFGMTVQWGF